MKSTTFRKLSASWSIDLEQDLKTMNGIDISKELTLAMAHEMGIDFNKPTIMSAEEYNADIAADHAVYYSTLGVLHPDGNIDLYLDGKPSGRMTQKEWNEKYFTEML